jgi:hypothetical protein
MALGSDLKKNDSDEAFRGYALLTCHVGLDFTALKVRMSKL